MHMYKKHVHTQVQVTSHIHVQLTNHTQIQAISHIHTQERCCIYK